MSVVEGRRFGVAALFVVGLCWIAAVPAKDSSAESGFVRQVMSVAQVAEKPGKYPGEMVEVLGYWAESPGRGALRLYWDPKSEAKPNNRTIFAVTGVGTGRWRTMDVALGFMTLSAGGPGHQVVFKSLQNNNPTRVHIEPRGYIDEGIASKFDMMFDDYDADPVNYRIVNLFTKQGRSATNSGLNGENGAAYFGAKAHGNQAGVWPSVHFGFGDGQHHASVPLKLYFFDTSDTAWRTPMLGAWRKGRPVHAGDFLLYNLKLYQANVSGRAGDQPPVHDEGTKSDGKVGWTFVRDYSTRIESIRSTVLIGDRDQMPKFGLPDVRLQLAKDTAVWNGQKVVFLDETGTPAISLSAAHGTDDLSIRSEKTGSTLRVDASGSFIQNNGFEWLMVPARAERGGDDVSLVGVEMLSFNNAEPQVVRSFLGKPYQRFYIESVKGNTTLRSSQRMFLGGGAKERVLKPNEVLSFVMDGSGRVARQVN